MAKTMKAVNDNRGVADGVIAGVPQSSPASAGCAKKEALKRYAKYCGDMRLTAASLRMPIYVTRRLLRVAEKDGLDKWGTVERYGLDDEVSEAVAVVRRHRIDMTEEMAYAGGKVCPNEDDSGGLEDGYGRSRGEADQALAAIRVYSAMVFARRGRPLPQEIEQIGPW